MSKNHLLSTALAASIASASVPSNAQEAINHTRYTTSAIAGQDICQVSQDTIQKEIHRHTRPHIIKSGEVIGTIAQKYGISSNQLIEIRKATESIPTNLSVDWTKLKAGETLQVPIGDSAMRKIQLYIGIQQKNNLDKELNALYEEWSMKELQKKLNETGPRLFPKEVINLGISATTQWLRGNMAIDYEPDNPIINDKQFQREVDCSGKVKGFFVYSLKKTDDVKKLSASESEDAWILLGSLLDIGFTRKIKDNLMVFFNKDKVWQREIIDEENEVAYTLAKRDLSRRIVYNGVPGSVVGAYFKGSNYKHVVREEYLKRKEAGEEYHINTHQFKITGIGEQNFQADTVKDYRSSSKGQLMPSEIGIIDFVTNYIQDKAPYEWLRSKSRRTIIETGLKNFHESLSVEVNGQQIDLLSELEKPQAQRVQIQASDTIRLSGPTAMDWFHVKTSDNKYKSENNTTRTFLFIQALVNPDFVLSEMIEPSKEMQNHKPRIGGVEYDIPVRNLVYLKEGDTIETAYKEGILKYIMWQTHLLEYTPEQIKKLNEIEAAKDISITSPIVSFLNRQRIQFRRDRVEATIASLPAEQKIQLQNEYARQIRALKLLGYMQSESETNPWAVKTNAPLPLIDTSKTNIDAIYTTYLNKRKKELQQEYKNSCHSDRNFLEIRFLEGDTSAHVFERVATQLSHYTERFPTFNALDDFTPLQKQEFLYRLTQESKIPGLNIIKGDIPSSGNIIKGLADIYTLVEEITAESHLPEIELSETDKIVVHNLADTEHKRKYYGYVLAQESYERWFPVRKVAKEIARITKIRDSRSFWDAQLRFANLLDPTRALRDWPNQKHIADFLQDLGDPKIQSTISYFLRFEKYRAIIEQDLAQVEELRTLNTQVNSENRQEIAKQMYDIITWLLRFDDGSGSNIVGKVATISFLDNKVVGHHNNLIHWIHSSGKSVEGILSSPELKERFTNLILTIGHRGETTILRAVTENYILRILETANVNTQSPDFPVPEINIKWQIDYTRATSSNNLDFYISQLSGHRLESVLKTHIQNIQEKKFSSASIFDLLQDTKIQEFLSDSQRDTHLLPTMKEFQTPGVRKTLFDYTTPPTDMTPPRPESLSSKIIEFFKIIGKNGNALQNLFLLFMSISLMSFPILRPMIRPTIWRLWNIITLTSKKSDIPAALELFDFKEKAEKMRKGREERSIWHALKEGWGYISVIGSPIPNRSAITLGKKYLQYRQDKKVFEYGKQQLIQKQIEQKMKKWNYFGVTDDSLWDKIWKELEEIFFAKRNATKWPEKKSARKDMKKIIISKYYDAWRTENPSLGERMSQKVSGIKSRFWKIVNKETPKQELWVKHKTPPKVESSVSPDPTIAANNHNPVTQKIEAAAREINALIPESV